jgi:RTX calcium-binding nonapeptide repeat (4 copies)
VGLSSTVRPPPSPCQGRQVTIKGGPGNDKLKGGPGKDKCTGGGGKDKAKGCEKKGSL